MNAFSKRLKGLREEKGITLSQLSKDLDISVACLSRWEAGLRCPNIESIILLCQYFSVTADYLIGLEE